MRPTDELHSDNHKRKAQKAKLAQQRLHLTAFGVGTRAAWGKPSFWFLKAAMPEPAAGEPIR